MTRTTMFACVCVTLGAALAGCTDDDVSSPPPESSSVIRTRLSAATLADLPPLQTNLPKRVPAANADLPSLLDDLPGRALMSYHPPEIFWDGPQGWASEDIMFYGADGHWRVLHMEDLGLPESAWVQDTYGPGALSSDGRWWVAFSREGPIVLNLSTGQVVPTDLKGYTAPPKWIPGRHVFVAHTTFGRSFRVSAVNGVATRTPYVAWQVGFQPDGTPVSLHRRPDNSVVFVGWQGNTPVPRTSVPNRFVDGEEVAKTSVLATNDRFLKVALSEQHKMQVLSSDTGVVESELIWPEFRPDYQIAQGWLDDQTMLISARGHLIAWRPDDGRVYRATRMPSHGYWSINVASASGF